ncbi:MAG: glycosyltransferase family 4 protein [Chloroflexi bacterium]|nr:glycosyltransferase family 4 protein [Chloroflexota bacterium]
MRIALNGIFFDQPATGSGQYLHALLAAMSARAPNNDFIVVVPESDLNANTLRALPNYSAQVFYYPERVGLDRFSQNLAKLSFEQLAFNRACRRERVALAHTPYFGSPLFPATRSVVTIHDLIPLILPEYRGSPLVRAYTQLVARAARRADAIIADSEASKRDIINRLGIDAARVHVIYLAAHARFNTAIARAQIDQVRRKYALPEKFLLYLGGFDVRKNVRVLIEAFFLLPELYRAGYRLILAGVTLGNDSKFFPDPNRLAREVGLADDAVRTIGWVAEEDKPALYASAEIFLFPSRYEGFGLPPLEAMACGAPVIAADASSLPEIVGDAALTAGVESPLAWAESMRAIINDATRRAEMRARGLAQARKFSWERAAQETLAVYESIL